MTLMPRDLNLAAPPRIGPRAYLLCGVGLFIFKFIIDHGIAQLLFGRTWSIYSYLIPSEVFAYGSLSPADRNFFLTMLAVALPFIVVGIVLTLRRLRDAGLPPSLMLLFFVPFVNLLFFTVLGFLPTNREKSAQELADDEDLESRLAPAPRAETGPQPAQPVVTGGALDYAQFDQRESTRPLSQWFPRDKKKSMAVAVLLPLPFAAGLTLLAVTVLRDYGFGIFVGLPFAIGLIAAVLHGYRVPRTAAQCMVVGCLALLVAGVALFSFAIEGLGCLIMLAPLAFPIAIFGALMGYTIQARPDSRQRIGNTLWSVTIALPLLVSAESIAPRQNATYAVTTVVEVNAPPEVVWHNVVTFDQIPPPTELVFRAGIAHPVRAHISGTGVGAVRYCEFSTGPFVEPITTWDEPRVLGFAVASNPAPMREWSPYRIHPPHLENFMVSHAGEFRLIELPDHRTRLEGTTWYEHRLFPESYWRLWSDRIIHRIHARVLNHVKQLSEREAASAMSQHS